MKNLSVMLNRKEEIQQESIKYQMSTKPMAIGGDYFEDIINRMNVNYSFIAGAEWADKTMIEKACNWLALNIGMLLKVLDVEYNTNETDIKDFIEDFRKAMDM